jgi:hypothetical protein
VVSRFLAESYGARQFLSLMIGRNKKYRYMQKRSDKPTSAATEKSKSSILTR